MASVAVVFWFSSATTPAGAQTAADRETARLLMDRADEQIEQGRPEQALALYLGAHGIMHVPSTGVEVARTYAALNKLLEARDAAFEVLRMPVLPGEPAAFRVAREAAEELARTLVEQVPVLNVEVVPPVAAQRATLFIDKRVIAAAAAQLPQALNPEEHLILVTAPDYRSAEQRIVLTRGEHRSLRITLEPMPGAARRSIGAPAQTPAAAAGQSRASWITWLGFGMGGAGILVGSAAGILSLERTSAARKHCQDNRCTPDAQDAVNAAHASANLSNAGLAVGALGLAVGVTSLWLGGSQPNKDHPRVGVAACHDGAMLRLEGPLW